MAATLDVIEDGRELPDQHPSGRLLLVLVSFAAGLGLGLITLGVQSGQPPPTGASVDDLSASDANQGISSRVPGFSDSLVLVAATENSAHDYILWPAEGPAQTRAMADGDEVLFDPSGTFIALLSSVPGLDGSLLSMGRFNLIRAVSSGVTSYAWHDSIKGGLAYTIEDDLGTHLYTLNFRGLKTEIPWIGPGGARVAAAGEWGWAIQASADEMVLLNPEGEFKASQSGRALASQPEGWIFVADGEEMKFVSSGGGVERLNADVKPGIVADASFSPSGSSVAIASSRGTFVFNRQLDEIQVLTNESVSWVRWSSDSRFVLTPATTGLTVYDIETGVGTEVLNQRALITVAVLPGRGP